MQSLSGLSVREAASELGGIEAALSRMLSEAGYEPLGDIQTSSRDESLVHSTGKYNTKDDMSFKRHTSSLVERRMPWHKRFFSLVRLSPPLEGLERIIQYTTHDQIVENKDFELTYTVILTDSGEVWGTDRGIEYRELYTDKIHEVSLTLGFANGVSFQTQYFPELADQAKFYFKLFFAGGEHILPHSMHVRAFACSNEESIFLFRELIETYGQYKIHNLL